MAIKAIGVMDVKVPVGDKRTEKSMSAFVLDQLQGYANGKVRVHVAAVESVLWAASVGSANLLNLMLTNLSKNDQDKLRVWVGKASTFKKEADDKEYTWIGFRSKDDGKKKAGFFVKTGAEFATAREAVDGDTLRNGSRFYDKADKAETTTDLAMILAMLAGLQKRTDKKAEKAAVQLPAEVTSEIAALVAIAKQAEAGKLASQMVH